MTCVQQHEGGKNSGTNLSGLTTSRSRGIDMIWHPITDCMCEEETKTGPIICIGGRQGLVEWPIYSTD